MGLTVHWNLSFQGDRKSVDTIFQAVAGKIRESSFGTSSAGPFLIENGGCEDAESEKYLGLCLFCADRNQGGEPVYPEEMYLLVGDPGPGSEHAQFHLGRYTGETEWTGSGFCKTQYAEHFLESHVMLCEWLNEFQRKGVRTDVVDEGNYWETRDIAKLLESYERFNIILESFTEELQKSGAKVEGEAPGYIRRRKKRLN